MPDAFLDGMTFAAIAQEDRDGAAAIDGLSARLAEPLSETLGALVAMDRTQRRAEVRRMAAHLKAVPTDADLPPRAAAMLVSDVPREIGVAWAARAAKVRRGFGVTPGLKTTLRRLARSADPTAEADERTAADRVDVDLAANADRLRGWARRIARGADEGRVLGALALGVLGRAGGDAVSRPWRRLGAELAEVWALADGPGVARLGRANARAREPR